MKTVLQKNNFGIVLKLDEPGNGTLAAAPSAHLVLQKCVLDDDGHFCLNAEAGFPAILDVIDSLKSELDSLANQSVQWFAKNNASRRAETDGLRRSRFTVIANDGCEAAVKRGCPAAGEIPPSFQDAG